MKLIKYSKKKEEVESRIKSFLNEISSLDYDNRKKFFHEINNNYYPRFLYKYLTIDTNDCKSIKKSEDIILDSKFYLSNPGSFNDPFDMKCKIVCIGEAAKIRKRIENLWIDLGVNKKDIRKKLPKAVIDIKNDSSFVNDIASRVLSNLGVFCFTKKPNDILMWSHYSDSHKGVCLQFDVLKDCNVFFTASRVEYNDIYPIINWIDDDFTNTLRPALLRKSTQWNYEEEYRIVNDQPGSYLKYNPDALTGIIFGCNTEEKTKNFIKELINKRIANGYGKTDLYSGVIHETNYKIVVRKIK